MCQSDGPLLAATQEQYCAAHKLLVIQSAYSQMFQKGIHCLNLSVNSWRRCWQESVLLRTVANVLKPENKKQASPWSDVPETVPFTLENSVKLGSSINWEPVHTARVVFVFQATDDTEIIGCCPRDFSFLRLQDFKGKRLFQYECFIAFYYPLVGWGG